MCDAVIHRVYGHGIALRRLCAGLRWLAGALSDDKPDAAEQTGSVPSRQGRGGLAQTLQAFSGFVALVDDLMTVVEIMMT